MGELRDLYGIRRDGSAVPLEIGLSPISTSSGLMIICTLVDISRRKEKEEDLRQLAAHLEKRNQQLVSLVATDSLTSVRSRQAFLDHLSAQLEVSVRHARPLSLLMLDIDDFKAFNDTFGHLAGDEVLKEVGRILPEVGRRSDLVGRLGGEEFGVILPETDREGAAFLGNRFREAVEAGDWPLRSITVSVGATTIHFPDTTPRPDVPPLSEILSATDQALYRSKDRGRNKVTHSEDPDWMTR
jgi:diguanylate cyclase (GGDEF)-like protein